MSRVDRFRELHHQANVLLMPNAWDRGSAKMLQHLGFSAIATTSGGAAAAHGLPDGHMSPEQVLAHCAELAAAVDVPVSADLEHGLATTPDGVARTIEQARAIDLAGASIEDWSGEAIYSHAQATERVQAAAEAAAGTLVITARAENHFRGIDDLDDTIARLQAYESAGADVLFAPGVRTREQISAVVAEIKRPLSVLAVRGTPPVDELSDLGVRRISVGASFAFSAYAALCDAATELLTHGTYDYTDQAARGRALARDALAHPAPASSPA